MDTSVANKQNNEYRKTSRRRKSSSQASGGLAPWSLGGSLVALGIVYGDLGTSPLYAPKALLVGQGGHMDRFQVLGSMSLVFWFMFLVITVKYVLTAMKADNHGEGGVFALFSAVRDKWKYMPVIAMIGGAAFLADSVFTPAVSITSAVEGLGSIGFIADSGQWSQELAIMLALVIILGLFLIQHSGTSKLGGLFGPVMLVWFGFMAVTGIISMSHDWTILEALNPITGIQFLFSSENKAGVAIMGSVFLAMTGAEALYSDMGHVGRKNVWATWPIVDFALICSYFGQGAWILSGGTGSADSQSPFFMMMDPVLRPFGVVLALMAGVIASQALISGAFTLVAAADGLNWLPRLKMSYPGTSKGQMYIPLVDIVLCVLTMFVVLYFKSSNAMEAAYGLALMVAMLMDSVLLFFYIKDIGRNIVKAVLLCGLFGVIELMFLYASMSKFLEGGYITALVWILVFGMFWVCSHGSRLETARRSRIPATELSRMLAKSIQDDKKDLVADNLIYLTPDSNMKGVEKDVASSMIRHRAKVYWVVSVIQSSNPYDCKWRVSSYGGVLHRVRICLGYKMPQFQLQSYMRQIMREMLRTGEIAEIRPEWPKIATKYEKAGLGSVKYVLMHRVMSPESQLPESDRTLLRMYQWLKKLVSKPVEWFGLETNDPIIDTVSVWRGDDTKVEMTRIIVKPKSDVKPTIRTDDAENIGRTVSGVASVDTPVMDTIHTGYAPETGVDTVVRVVDDTSNGFNPDATGVMEPIRTPVAKHVPGRALMKATDASSDNVIKSVLGRFPRVASSSDEVNGHNGTDDAEHDSGQQ